MKILGNRDFQTTAALVGLQVAQPDGALEAFYPEFPGALIAHQVFDVLQREDYNTAEAVENALALLLVRARARQGIEPNTQAFFARQFIEFRSENRAFFAENAHVAAVAEPVVAVQPAADAVVADDVAAVEPAVPAAAANVGVAVAPNVPADIPVERDAPVVVDALPIDPEAPPHGIVDERIPVFGERDPAVVPPPLPARRPEPAVVEPPVAAAPVAVAANVPAADADDFVVDDFEEPELNHVPVVVEMPAAAPVAADDEEFDQFNLFDDEPAVAVVEPVVEDPMIARVEARMEALNLAPGANVVEHEANFAALTVAQANIAGLGLGVEEAQRYTVAIANALAVADAAIDAAAQAVIAALDVIANDNAGYAALVGARVVPEVTRTDALVNQKIAAALIPVEAQLDADADVVIHNYAVVAAAAAGLPDVNALMADENHLYAALTGVIAGRAPAANQTDVIIDAKLAATLVPLTAHVILAQEVPALATGDILARAQQVKAAEAAFIADRTLNGQLGVNVVMQAAYQQQLAHAKPAVNAVTQAKVNRINK